jgi:hypothetical protein
MYVGCRVFNGIPRSLSSAPGRCCDLSPLHPSTHTAVIDSPIRALQPHLVNRRPPEVNDDVPTFTHPVLLILVILTGVIAGCGSEKATIMESKLDPSLRQKLFELHMNENAEPLSIFGKCTQAIDANMHGRLRDAGATVEAVAGDIFTARVSRETLAKLSQLDFILQLQLSHTSNPLPK